VEYRFTFWAPGEIGAFALFGGSSKGFTRSWHSASLLEEEFAGAMGGLHDGFDQGHAQLALFQL
jgi:hypothetical protein